MRMFSLTRALVCLLAFCLSTDLHAQNLKGQWKGGFVSDDDPWGRKTEYVVELEIDGREVSGYSYTYFMIRQPQGLKRCYVICRLVGEYDKGSKSVVFREVEKVKSNTPPPPEFNDCFQFHSLTYMKQDDRELLIGKWKPAKQGENCGTGSTQLERRTLVAFRPGTSAPAKPRTETTKPGTTTPVKPAPAKPASPKAEEKKPEIVTVTPTPKPSTVEKPKSAEDVTHTAPLPKESARVENRTKQILRTIDLQDASSFRVDLYDNGEIDGDTVSVFYNGRLLASRKMLKASPLSFTLTPDLDREDNELVMYAENLGSIPPNTALMVVTVMDKRYEVRITSTDQTSGTVRFIWKKP